MDALGAGVSADTVRDAAAARIVAIAVPWPRVAAAVAGCSGTVRPSPTPQLFEPSDPGGPTTREMVAELVPAREAANTLGAQVLGSDPHEAGGPRVIFESGDYAAAMAEVADQFDAAGFFVIDLGYLATGGRIQQTWRPTPGTRSRQAPRGELAVRSWSDLTTPSIMSRAGRWGDGAGAT